MESKPADRHYTVDYTGGTVEFGGVRVPQLGERIRTLTYQYCMGTAGIPAGAVNGITTPGGVTVTNPLPVAGGMDAASDADALDAIPAEIHRQDRAVTAADFGEAEKATGVARAEPLALLHPDTPAVRAAGVVSVVIFPDEDLTAPGRPAARARAAAPGRPLPGRAAAGHHRALRHPPDLPRDRRRRRARRAGGLPGGRRPPLGGPTAASVPQPSAAVRTRRDGLAAGTDGAPGRARSGGRPGGRVFSTRPGSGSPVRTVPGATPTSRSLRSNAGRRRNWWRSRWSRELLPAPGRRRPTPTRGSTRPLPPDVC